MEHKGVMELLGSGWPDGWYVYENGHVEGPLSAAATFRLPAETSDGKPRLVSRKGFAQWYALKDLSEIFRMTEQMGEKASTFLASAEVPGGAAKPFIPKPPLARRPEVKGRQVEVRAAPLPSKRVDTGIVKGAAAAEPERSQESSFPRTKTGQKTLGKNLVLQEYFLARGRLRLGRLRNPWISAFVGLPLSLGVFWLVWFAGVAREAVFHTKNQDKSPLPPLFLAIIPGVHIYMAYRLGCLVRDMEAQNKYRGISPALAALYSLLPPLTLLYLQRALNRHWLLHAKHALAKKRAEVPAA